MTETVTAADPNTGAGLIEFLDAAIEKGWLNISSAKAMRTASQKIMSVEDGWERLDLRSLDIDGLFEQFRNLRRNDYSDDSMRIYRKRFEMAVKMHLARVDGDASWRTYGPAVKSTSSPTTNGKTTPKRRAPSKEAPDAAPREEGEPDVPEKPLAGSPGLLRLPFPLREDMDVHLQLPRDLTEAEAKRLSNFIHSLARPEVKQITQSGEAFGA